MRKGTQRRTDELRLHLLAAPPVDSGGTATDPDPLIAFEAGRDVERPTRACGDGVDSVVVSPLTKRWAATLSDGVCLTSTRCA